MKWHHLLILILTTTLAVPDSLAQGKGKGKGKGRSSEEEPEPVGPIGGFTTTITKVQGASITYLQPADEADSETPSRGKGKGKGKGRFRSKASGTEVIGRLSEKALITTATSTRRTGDLIVGIELSGGIRNTAFQQIGEDGLPARMVIKDDQIVEINVLIAQDDNEAPIAVKPKRPPMKQ